MTGLNQALAAFRLGALENENNSNIKAEALRLIRPTKQKPKSERPSWVTDETEAESSTIAIQKQNQEQGGQK